MSGYKSNLHKDFSTSRSGSNIYVNIPRWLSVWGLIGGLLYFAEPVLAMFGSEFEILFAPLALQEMVLAIWLIVKGFNSPTIDSLSAK
ncbi:MAG: DUF4386 domain-containing protein [Deltaproteobacteria bacterium]|nr:DUF4386 domain-containing protein [Deltaproteobacteria bacterium]